MDAVTTQFMVTTRFTVGTAGIQPRRLVKLNADGTVDLATAATDAIIGVSLLPDYSRNRYVQAPNTLVPNPIVTNYAAAIGEGIDIAQMNGQVEVVLGGTVARGAAVTAGAAGAAVAASVAGNRIVGICIKGGASGDIGIVMLAPGVF